MKEHFPGLGGRLKEYFSKKGMSAREVGRVAGINAVTIGRMYKGEDFKASQLALLKSAFPDLDIPFLLFGNQQPEPAQEAVPIHMQALAMAQKIKLDLASENLNGAELSELLNLVEELARHTGTLKEKLLASLLKLQTIDERLSGA